MRASAALYARQAEALQAALARHLGDHIEVGPIDGGMFLWARVLDPSLDTTELLRVAVERGVAFVPGVAFHVNRPGDDTPLPHSNLRMSFATLPDGQFDEAARRLAAAVATMSVVPV